MDHKQAKLRTTAYLIGLALYGLTTHVFAETLNEATAKAISKHPELRSRYYDYRAAGEDQKAIKGRYLPRVDVAASYNKEWQTRPIAGSYDFNHPGASIELRQILFDGLYTQSESRRLGYTRETRMQEVQAASDDMAMEAARAYYDVLRYRKLADLARDNYATHKEIYDQIQERVKAGVGRRVDLEQAAGRMALAESNWLTEQANLYDVTARYARVIGEEPPVDLSEPGSFDGALPTQNDLLALTIKNNPSFLAAIANVRAARARIETQKSNNYPKLEFVASRGIDKNRDGIDGNFRDGLVGVSLNWNLFNGGTDQANTRSAAEAYNGAIELRDKVCRDVRQVTQSAWNNVVRLREQIAYLDQHQLSTEKARDAYRKQFDIGQRTLLDVLDSENELFDARRSLANGEYDQKIAVVRVLAQSHTLLPALKLQSLVDGEQLDDQGDRQMSDEQIGCSTTLPNLGTLDKEAAMVGRPTAAELKAADIAQLEKKPAAAAPVDAATLQKQQVTAAVQAWASAWSQKNVDGYLAAYSPHFRAPVGKTAAGWAAERRARLTVPKMISVNLGEIKVSDAPAGLVQAQFQQRYQSDLLSDVTNKTLLLQKSGEQWLIVEEQAGT